MQRTAAKERVDLSVRESSSVSHVQATPVCAASSSDCTCSAGFRRPNGVLGWSA